MEMPELALQKPPRPDSACLPPVPYVLRVRTRSQLRAYAYNETKLMLWEDEMELKEKACGCAGEFAEKHFVEAVANLEQCKCMDEHRLHVALSETRARPGVYAPDHIGIKGARCATFGRCK
jgi:hypothetical protein